MSNRKKLVAGVLVATMALAEQRLTELKTQRAELDGSIAALTTLLSQGLTEHDLQRTAA